MKRLGKISAFCLAAALSLTVSAGATGPTQNTEYEQSAEHSTYGAAMRINNDCTYKGFLANDEEEDWYVVNFPSDGAANFWMCFDSDASLSFKVFTLSEGKLVPSGNGPAQANHQAFLADAVVTGGVDYYVKVSGTTGSGRADYDLRARLIPASADLPHNQDYSISTESLDCYFDVSGENPCWRVWASNTSSYDLDINVWDEDGNRIDGETVLGGKQTSPQLSGTYEGSGSNRYRVTLASKYSYTVTGKISIKVGRDADIPAAATRDLGDTKLRIGKTEKTEAITVKNRCVKVYIQNDGPSNVYCYVTDDQGNPCGEPLNVKSGDQNAIIKFENTTGAAHGYTFHYQASSGSINQGTGWWHVRSAATWEALDDEPVK